MTTVADIGRRVTREIPRGKLRNRVVAPGNVRERPQRSTVGTRKVAGHKFRNPEFNESSINSIAMAGTADMIPLWNKDTNPKFFFRPQIVASETAPPHFALVRKLKGLQGLLVAPEADAFSEERHREVLSDV